MALLAAGIWVLAATAIALLPRRFHWPGAVGLILTGVPLIGWLTWVHGPLAGLIALAAGASVLRWPLFYLGHWLRRKVTRKG